MSLDGNSFHHLISSLIHLVENLKLFHYLKLAKKNVLFSKDKSLIKSNKQKIVKVALEEFIGK